MKEVGNGMNKYGKKLPCPLDTFEWRIKESNNDCCIGNPSTFQKINK